MSKKELIQHICQLDKSAKPELLVNFSPAELYDYLCYLTDLKSKKLPASVRT